MVEQQQATHDWSKFMFDQLYEGGIRIFAHIPDAGNDRLIHYAGQQDDTQVVLLTTEEEGIAICAGVDLARQRGILCMQSSGLGNCVNYLSLVKAGKFPLLMMITMRGDYGEQNPWQYPMGAAVEDVLETMGVSIYKIEQASDVDVAVQGALHATAAGAQAAAIVVGQKFLGAKAF